MAASDINNVAYIVKRLYNDREPENLASRRRLWLTKVPKQGDFVGESLTVPIKIGNPMNISTTLAGAQASAAGNTAGRKWVATRVLRYGDVVVDGPSILATGNNKGAFVELLEQEINGTLDEHGRRLSNDLYGNGSGSLGKVSAVAAGVITLVNADDAKNFGLNQTIGANPTETGAPGSMRAGQGTVSAINEDGSQITYTGTITAIAAGDFLYNANASATDYDFGFKGLAAHIPLVAPVGGDSFFSVDRSADVNRLAGWRLNQLGYSIEENAYQLGVRIMRAGGVPDLGLISPSNFVKLVLSLGTKVEYTGGSTTAEVGFQYVTLQLPSGPCKMYADPDAPSDRFYLLQTDTWKIRFLGNGFPHIIMDDSLRMLRMATLDAIELRTRSIAQMVCTAPGYNGVAAC